MEEMELDKEIKEEDIKPTKKTLAAILSEYQRSQSLKKSTDSSHQLRNFEPTQNDSYKCGLCGYRAEMEEKIYAHWKMGCELMKVEERNGKPETYQCAGCGARMESLVLIEQHMNLECHGLTKFPLDRTT